MTAAAGLLLLALLGPPQPRTYYWRDAQGQTHITNTPPPPGAELLEAPPPPAVEAGRAHPEPVRQSLSGRNREPLVLSPGQKLAWEGLDRRLAQARAAGDRNTLEAVGDSLLSDCLWGNGLWALPALPILVVLLMGLMGWWLALSLQTSLRLPLVAVFLVLGLGFGQVLISAFLFHPQAERIRQNLNLLEHHLGVGRPARPEAHAQLLAHHTALEAAAQSALAPWQFPAEVQRLRATLRKVMVDP